MKYRAASLFGLYMITSQCAAADGLTDLKSALAELKGKGQISALLDYQVTEIRGEDEDKKERQGGVSVQLNASRKGMQVSYSNVTMDKIDIEAQSRLEDEEAETPTLMALDEINTTDLRNILSAAASIERRIQQASFVDEVEIEEDGKTLRQLNFSLPLESIIRDKRTRDYVSKFTSDYQIVIDQQGIPLQTKLTYHGKGRAYIVIRVEASGESQSAYQVHNQRLVRIDNHSISRFDSTFGEGESIDKQSLQLLDSVDTQVVMAAPDSQPELNKIQ